MAKRDAKRKILFFRADPDDGIPADAWDPAAIHAKIKALTGKARYFIDRDGVNRAEAATSNSGAPSLRFFKVRGDELPGVDDGDGNQEDLPLKQDQGLLEAIHIRLFPNRVIGAEFFFYGPRITRFERYLRDKQNLQFSLRQLARHEVIDEALAFHEIRLLTVKLDPSTYSKDKAALKETSLQPVMDLSEAFHAGAWAKVTLRAGADDPSFMERVKNIFKRVKQGETDAAVFEKLEIEGKPKIDSTVSSLDVLAERLYRIEEIPYRTERYRELDAGAAFAAIQKAYDDVQDDLPKDALAS